MTDFVDAYQVDLGGQLSSVEEAAALLRTRLTEEAGKHAGYRSWAAIAAMAAFFLAGILFVMKQRMAVETSSIPRPDLTPGAVTAISLDEACNSPVRRMNGEVSVALQAAVFREYGITHPRPRGYEVDYLITPELGGASDIRNLWPEPYFTPVWNARVKDALEDRLHEMVCSGQLDLATAQRDIATDWTRAYKKYFHTDQPLREER